MAEMLKTFAEDLKAVREEKNLSLRTISQQTRLSISILENLENGDYTFQPQAYIRAFLKQYINSLGLDTEDVLFDYDLARSGKYKPKRQNTISEDASQKEITQEPVEEKPKITEKIKEMIETPRKVDEEKKEKGTTSKENSSVKTSEVKKDSGPERNESKYSIKAPGNFNQGYNSQGLKKNKFSFSFLNSPLVKNIVLIVFILLLLLGVYSLVNILFLEKSGDNPEVIRQNFDDVVKEQEKKILGKRTPEEIQDSIRKAEEELAATKDSITLKITGLREGTIFLVSDSVNYGKPEKIGFGKNEFGEFKAHRSFHISSANTDDFKATINDKPIRFGKTSISKVKIDKNGIVK
ncbi:MAG: helix-turn-helix transcriptional regulator [Ignavibacteria bacterium]